MGSSRWEKGEYHEAPPVFVCCLGEYRSAPRPYTLGHVDADIAADGIDSAEQHNIRGTGGRQWRLIADVIDRRDVEVTQVQANLITDISPWPSGRGFTGGAGWWQHVLSQDERKRLDNLVGIAMLDSEISNQLLAGKSDALFSAFGLSEETQQLLRSIQATNLVDYAQAITCGGVGD